MAHEGAFVDDDPVEEGEVGGGSGSKIVGAVFLFAQAKPQKGVKGGKGGSAPGGPKALPKDAKGFVCGSGDGHSSAPDHNFHEKFRRECRLSRSGGAGENHLGNLRMVEEILK